MTTKKPARPTRTRAKARAVEAWGLVVDGKLRATTLPTRKSAVMFLAFAETKGRPVRVRITPIAGRR